MDDRPPFTLPFTLWLETLPTDDTASLLVRATTEAVEAVLFWNQDIHSVRRFPTREAAETYGYELREILLQDALAGILLGYDTEVLDRLQAQCSST